MTYAINVWGVYIYIFGSVSILLPFNARSHSLKSNMDSSMTKLASRENDPSWKSKVSGSDDT